MVRGFAGGYGYDKRTAAVQDAIAKLPHDAQGSICFDDMRAFIAAIDNAGGEYFDKALAKAGFTVLQAV